MITIIGRRLIIPDCDRVLGVTEDANTKIKIKLSSDTVERYFPDSASVDNVGITLVMEYEDGTEFSSVAFPKSDNGVHEGYVNLVGVTKVGLLNARALLTYSEETKDGDTVSTVTTSMQTESDYFYISEDIEAGDINKNGSTLTAWSRTLEDIKKETKNLNTAVTTATNAASSASGSADNASKSEADAKNWATYAESCKNEAESAKDTAVSAKDTAVSAKDEAAGLVGKYSKHLPDYNNPHKVTAEQVGAYDKKVVDTKIDGITPEKLGVYNKDEVNNLLKYYDKNKENFKWTDFDYFADGENGFIAKVYDDKIVIDNAVGNEYVQLVCRGNTLGFSFTIAGYTDAILRINGEVKRYINDKKDGSVFASDTIPLTYIGDKDIFLVGNDNTWNFADMIKQSESDNHNIVVDKELDADSDNAIANSAVAKAIGDIDTALDAILEIQAEFIGEELEGTLPGDLDEPDGGES